MRIDENTILLLHHLYEHGGCDYKTICDRLEINPSYKRERAREVITHFINTRCVIEDNIHPLLNLHPLIVREIIEMLQTDSKGAKLKLEPDGPSVW